jgi:hypothetical protein
MKLLIIYLFLLGLQGCAVNEMWVGNVYDDNNDIVWSDVFKDEDRCKETTPNMVSKFEYRGAWDWDCILNEKASP